MTLPSESLYDTDAFVQAREYARRMVEESMDTTFNLVQPLTTASDSTLPEFTYSGGQAIPNTQAAYEGVLFKPKKMTEAAKLQTKVNEAVRSVMLNELQISRAAIKAEIRTEIDGVIREAKEQITKGAVAKAVDEAIKRINIEGMIATTLSAIMQRRVDLAGSNSIPELRGKVDAEVNRQVQAKVTEWLSANVQLSLKGKAAPNEGMRRLISD